MSEKKDKKENELHIENVKQDKVQTKVYNILQREINRGAFPDGKLPSENKLAKLLGVSRATISITLAFMEREGMVVRRHGSATYVNQAYASIKAQITDGIGVYDLIEKCGYTPSLMWSKIEKLSPGLKADYVINKLKLEKGMEVFCIRRLFCADEHPAVYVEEYIPSCNLIETLNLEELPETIYKLSEKFCEHPIEFTIVDLVPYMPDDMVNSLFGPMDSAGILLSEELHLDNASKPVIFSRVYTYDKYVRYQALRVRK